MLSSTIQPDLAELNELLVSCGEPSRPLNKLIGALDNSLWYLTVTNQEGKLIGFVRATSDKALNANLWDLVTLPNLVDSSLVLEVLAQEALTILRKDFPSCSISLAASPEALIPLQRLGFLVDPDGIRAMGLTLNENVV
ncbi:GNAT family acetyltransferase (chromatophore) [Paulinella micropora]|uniref:GNAT family acetyltransferase n=1 Tax=Paulinella micropora TaxID=1928728 RepID=A0A5K7W649_9EUKA|nr:GNAT family acetyltransferase [Paulinella micropora]